MKCWNIARPVGVNYSIKKKRRRRFALLARPKWTSTNKARNQESLISQENGSVLHDYPIERNGISSLRRANAERTRSEAESRTRARADNGIAANRGVHRHGGRRLYFRIRDPSWGHFWNDGEIFPLAVRWVRMARGFWRIRATRSCESIVKSPRTNKSILLSRIL